MASGTDLHSRLKSAASNMAAVQQAAKDLAAKLADERKQAAEQGQGSPSTAETGGNGGTTTH